MQPMRATFEDTVAFADSTIPFSAREFTAIEVNPWTRIITKARRFQDAVLRAARIETTETSTDIDWLFSLGAFVLGMIIALLLI
jgi:hypothetical protein